MAQRDQDIEDAEFVEYEEVSPQSEPPRNKKVVVYGEYDKYRHSALKRTRIKFSLMDILVIFIILVILGFIGYRSYESYGANSRDDIRTGHLAIIREGLDKLVKEGRELPEAYLKKEILANGSVIGVQGFAGETLFSTIGKRVLKDPLDSSYYIYYYAPQTQQYEVMAYLEGESQDLVASPVQKTLTEKIKGWFVHTTDYKNRTPYSIGAVGNILVANVGEAQNTPLNILIPSDSVDLSNMAKYEDTFYIGATCQDILSRYPDNKGKDGIHMVLMNSKITKIYCDMTTDGGGWTLFYANNGHPTSPIRESYVAMRDKMARGVYDLSVYSNPNLVGLLDTTHFTTNGAKEVLATNRVGGRGQWIKFTFDTSASLAWALGKDILGRTSEGCYTIPNNGSWSIVSNDKKIAFYGLNKIMNARGNSWGVSHVAYICNNQKGSISPHIAFYAATDNSNNGRTRGNEGIGGNIGGENEYRYFIR